MRILLPMQVTLAVPSALAANAVQQGVSGGGQLFKQKIIGNLSFVQHKRAVQKMLDIIEIMHPRGARRSSA